MDYILNLSKYPEDLLCRVARAIYRHLDLPVDNVSGGDWPFLARRLTSSQFLLMLAAHEASSVSPDAAAQLEARWPSSIPEDARKWMREFLERSHRRAGLERLHRFDVYLSSGRLGPADADFLRGLLEAVETGDAALEQWLESRGV